VFRAAIFHFRTHWSNQANFWSGITGMLVNNSLILFGIWAMLFAGKSHLNESRDGFLMMNLILMLAWGCLHVFGGGATTLDTQITQGHLDSAMTTPRAPLLVLSLTSSYLPAWGDMLLGFIGILAFSFRLGPVFFLHALLISIFATLALLAVYLFIGCLAFWFRRTDNAHSVLVNICLAFNTYPVYEGSGAGPRWMIFILPLLLSGAVPAAYLVNPSLKMLALEAGGSVVMFFLARAVFHRGLRRYQSASVPSLQRS
jgi:ABC-2 type transport system permease protein